MTRSTDDDDSLGPVIRDRRRIDPVTGQVRNSGRPGAEAEGSSGGPAQSGPAQSGPAQSGQAKPQPRQAQPRPGKHSASRPGGQPGGTRGASSRGAAEGGRPDRADDPAASGPAKANTDDLSGAEARLAERTADLQRLQAEYANYRKRVERDRIAVREQALANVLGALLPVLDDIGRAREHGELEGGFKSVAESLEAAAVKLGLTSYGEDGDPFDPNVHEALMHSYSDEVAEATCVRILQPGYMVGDRILRPARVAVAEPGQSAGPGPADGEPAGAAGAGSEPAAASQAAAGQDEGDGQGDAQGRASGAGPAGPAPTDSD